MGRIIKFRAWDESRSKMIYQFGTLGNNEPQLISDDEDGRLFCGHYKSNGDWIQPILMQFTGLYDKNGKEIYEGDIVEFQYYNIDLKGYISCGVVEWREAGFMFGKMVNVPINGKHSYNIIGNIYENPELLND